METKLSISLICFTLVTILVRESNGIKCYQCGSILSVDTSCEDPFKADGVTTVDCTGGSCTKTKVDLNGQQIISRDCQPSVTVDKCAEESQGGNEAHVCYCTGDKCNTATSATVTMAKLLFTTAGIFLYNMI